MSREMLKSFAQEQIRLVKEEQQVNVENSHKLLAGSVGELQRLGHALVNLTVSAVRAGLGSKTNMSFSNSITGLDLAQNNFKLGDVVAVEEHGKAAHGQTPASTGIVSAVGDKQISVDVKMDVPEYRLFRLIKLANSVSYERIIESLTKLSDTIEPYSDLYSVLLGMKEPTFIDEPVEILDVELNPSQRAACVHAVSANQIALIHGPPGTGKTHTSIEIIRQAVARNQKVLVCAPSNIAVDNIAERLMAYKIRAVRIGHSSRMVNAVAPCSLDYQLKYSDNGLILNDARAALDGTLKKMLCAKKREKRELHIEMKELRKEVRLRQTNVLAGILRNAEVVLATLNTAASKMLKQTHFDLVIIDEVSQALEAECWIAIQKARRCVLVGDPLQLAPTVMKQNSSLSVTMFYRLNKRYPQLTRLLDTQYRMNDLIVGFSLINVYENKLLSHSSCSAGLLCDLDGVSNDDLARFPLVFIDTTGQEEAEMDDGDSKFNNQEADLAVKHISALIECGVSAMDIGVISPYSAQTRRIRNILKEKWPQVVCSSIDGFQGREKQVIILSLVRCNDTGTVGFLESINRLNVAMTRAKRHLCVIGNAQTLARDATLKSLVAYLEDKAELLWYD